MEDPVPRTCRTGDFCLVTSLAGPSLGGRYQPLLNENGVLDTAYCNSTADFSVYPGGWVGSISTNCTLMPCAGHRGRRRIRF